MTAPKWCTAARLSLTDSVISVSTVSFASHSYRSQMGRFDAVILGTPYIVGVANFRMKACQSLTKHPLHCLSEFIDGYLDKSFDKRNTRLHLTYTS